MTARQQVQGLLNFIDASPSPWHVVHTLEKLLESFQFERLDETCSWPLQQGGRYYVIRDDSSLVLFVLGQKPLLETGYKIVGAHTDSPGLRVKPNAAHAASDMLRLGVEVYGGPILATFTDRDLSLAGRVSYRADQGHIETRLVKFDKPLIRLPNLAIHMNRQVNNDGLKLNKQTELPLLLSALVKEQIPEQYFLSLLSNRANIEAERILSCELNVFDTQKGNFWGPDKEFYTDSQLDNLASCHAALEALFKQTTLESDSTLVCAFFDHEEIGSESMIGADSSFLPSILERIALASDLGREDYQRVLAQSFMISADMAHAFQPNFPNAYEPEHHVLVNQGPVIKVNANHRYTSECISQAMFANWCEQVGAPYQKYSHRTDIACGSTIGPLISAKLGIRCVDVGNPMWAMHSIRESAGVQDHDFMIRALRCFFEN